MNQEPQVQNSPNRLARSVAGGLALLGLGVIASEVMGAEAAPVRVPESLCNPDQGDVCTPVTDPETGSTIPLTLPVKTVVETSTTIPVTSTTVEGTTTTAPEVTTTTGPTETTTTVVETSTTSSTTPSTLVPPTVPGDTK